MEEFIQSHCSLNISGGNINIAEYKNNWSIDKLAQTQPNKNARNVKHL